MRPQANQQIKKKEYGARPRNQSKNVFRKSDGGKPKDWEALSLINNSMIMICLNMAVMLNQPCHNYCDFTLEEAMPN